MNTFIISLIILFAILLVLVILAQNSKGGGLSSQFGGSATSSMIGVKKTTDLLEKLTWGFAFGIIVLSMITNLDFADANPNDFSDRVDEVQAPDLQIPDLEGMPQEGQEILEPLDAAPDSTN